MTDDRRTKAQLLIELANAEDAARLARARVDELQASRPARVPAADALAGCIRALDPLVPTKSTGYTYGGTPPVLPEIASVLRHLIDRYGIDMMVRVTEPCARHHVDDAPDELLIHALRRKSSNDFEGLFR